MTLNALKLIMLIVGITFCALEIPLLISWLTHAHSLTAANNQFLYELSHDRLFQMFMIDLNLSSILIIVWIFIDNRRTPSNPSWLPWVCLLIMPISTTLCLILYFWVQNKSPLWRLNSHTQLES